MNVRTIIGVLFGLALFSCSSEIDRNEVIKPIEMVEVKKELPKNDFLGCWEEKIDSLEVYWCFDSTTLNYDGYIHNYVFHDDTLNISGIEYVFSISENNLNLNQKGKQTRLKKSTLTESPNVF